MTQPAAEGDESAEAFGALVHTLAHCACRDVTEDVADRLTRMLGLDYFSYVVPACPPGREGAGMLLTSYPARWRTRYRSRSYDLEDAVVVHGRHAHLPFAWGDDAYVRALPASGRRLFMEGRDFGIVHGFTVPIHGPRGDCALFSVSSPGTRTRLVDVSNAEYRALLVFAQCLHANVLGRRTVSVDDAAVALSEHERVCLVWTSRGKTAWEIAQIIGRSQATVEFHIRRATLKLGAANKVHAAFRALQLDLF